MKSLRLLLLVALLALPALLSAAGADPGVIRYPGKFAWVDLVTTDPAAEIKFYTKLFGWTTRELRGTRDRYTLLLNKGSPMAGVAYRKADPDSKQPAGARWVGSISVSDINQAASAVTGAGGRVLVAPRQIAGRGWQALVADPEGCIFGLIITEAGDPPDGNVAQNGWIWAQLISGQPAAAAAFYTKALGYNVTEDTRTVRTDDFLLSHDGHTCAGLTPLPEAQGARPGWLGYVLVEDTATVVDAAKALGGRVLYSQNEPGKLPVAIIADPLGGAIGVVSRPAPLAPEESK